MTNPKPYKISITDTPTPNRLLDAYNLVANDVTEAVIRIALHTTPPLSPPTSKATSYALTPKTLPESTV